MKRRCCAALALLALAASPAAGLPRDRACRPLQAATAVDGKGFADLRLRLAPGTGVRMSAGNAEPGLPPPTSCELDATRYGTAVSCRWEHDAFTEANAAYDGLLAELRRCTGLPLEQLEGSSGDAINFLRRHGSEIPVGAAATRVGTELLEFRSGGYWVELEVEYDPDGAADLIEDGDDID